MMLFTIAHNYFIWHYTQALVSLFNLYTRMLWFTVYFFSIPTLITSLFSPWKRMVDTRSETWNIEDFAGTLVINLLSRIVGAFVRMAVIIVGVCILAVEVLSIGALYVFWLTAPFLVFGCIILGVTLITIS